MQMDIPSMSSSVAIRMCMGNGCRLAQKMASLCILAKSGLVRPVWLLIKHSGQFGLTWSQVEKEWLGPDQFDQ